MLPPPPPPPPRNFGILDFPRINSEAISVSFRGVWPSYHSSPDISNQSSTCVDVDFMIIIFVDLLSVFTAINGDALIITYNYTQLRLGLRAIRLRASSVYAILAAQGGFLKSLETPLAMPLLTFRQCWQQSERSQVYLQWTRLHVPWYK